MGESADDDVLAQKMQSLPTELFDEIYELVFAVDEKAVMTIDKSYKPPVQLQVNRASRKAFAKGYYRATAFSYPASLIQEPFDPVVTWLRSLPLSYREAIRQIRWPRKYPTEISSKSRGRASYDLWKGPWATELRDYFGYRYVREKLCTKILGKREDGRWVSPKQLDELPRGSSIVELKWLKE